GQKVPCPPVVRTNDVSVRNDEQYFFRHDHSLYPFTLCGSCDGLPLSAYSNGIIDGFPDWAFDWSLLAPTSARTSGAVCSGGPGNRAVSDFPVGSTLHPMAGCFSYLVLTSLLPLTATALGCP